MHVLGGRCDALAAWMRPSLRHSAGRGLRGACCSRGCGYADGGPRRRRRSRVRTRRRGEHAHQAHARQAAPVRHQPLRGASVGSRCGCRRRTPRRARPASAPTTTAASCWTRARQRPVHHRLQRAAGQPRRRAPRDPVPGPARRRSTRPRQTDAATPGQGWTCFGDAGIGAAAANEIDDAPWLGAWAPGGSEQVYGQGFGERSRRGLTGRHAGALQPAGRQGARHAAPPSCGSTPEPTKITPLVRPSCCRRRSSCRAVRSMPTASCASRASAVADVKKRFGDGPGATADLLHFLCGPIQAGTGAVVRRGRSTARDHPRRGGPHAPARQGDQDRCQPGQGDAQPSWTYRCGTSTTRAASRSTLSRLRAGDTVKVTCRHSQSPPRPAPCVRGDSGEVRRLGRRHHRRDVPGDPAGHSALTIGNRQGGRPALPFAARTIEAPR